ncbi:MAG TPA: hypothetical protein VFC92_08620 [Bacteroidales bacterium]|nr:hypothetical protein [Bacteroidales bacterium]
MPEKETSTLRKYLVISANSLAYFMLAYLFIILLINFVSMLMAKIFYGVGSTMTQNGFDIDKTNFHWTLESVVLIFFIGVMVAMLFGVWFQMIYIKTRKGNGHLKIFFMWSYMIAYTIFFGDLVFGAFFNYMPGAFFNFMAIPMFLRLVIGIGGLVMLFVVGWVSAKNVVISLNIYLRKASISQIRPYVMAQLLVPFVVGNAIIFFLKWPLQAKFQYLDTLVLLTMGLILVGVIFAIGKQQSIRFTRHHDSFRVRWVPVLLSVGAIIAYVLIFNIGHPI